jgi:hypothetical protein
MEIFSAPPKLWITALRIVVDMLFEVVGNVEMMNERGQLDAP